MSARRCTECGSLNTAPCGPEDSPRRFCVSCMKEFTFDPEDDTDGEA